MNTCTVSLEMQEEEDLSVAAVISLHVDTLETVSAHIRNLQNYLMRIMDSKQFILKVKID